MPKTLEKIKNIYCVGIGGSGVSAIAAILKKSGKNVSGSDSNLSPTTEKLTLMGIPVQVGHNAKNPPDNTDLLIYSPAVNEDNTERIKAKQLGIPQLSYPEAVGKLTKEKNTVAVCGTHGKTTVTSMVSSIFINAGKDPSVLVGSHIKELENENHRLGKGEWLIIEACEYCRNFLNYHPYAIILNNIEADHLDYYKDSTDYISAFHEFILKLPKKGLLIANNEDQNTITLVKKIQNERQDIKIVTFGGKFGDFHVKDGQILHQGKMIGILNMKIPGRHNVLNALGALALSISIGIHSKAAINAINNFSGAARRFEFLGERDDTKIYSDYAHHPTEIKATLLAAREKFGDETKILAVFQPHQYSRTYKLRNSFAKAFNQADMTIVSDIFMTRDSGNDISKIDSEKLVKLIRTNNKNVQYGGDLNKTFKKTDSILGQFDVVIIMGAGNVDIIAKQLLTK